MNFDLRDKIAVTLITAGMVCLVVGLVLVVGVGVALIVSGVAVTTVGALVAVGVVMVDEPQSRNPQTATPEAKGDVTEAVG